MHIFSVDMSCPRYISCHGLPQTNIKLSLKTHSPQITIIDMSRHRNISRHELPHKFMKSFFITLSQQMYHVESVMQPGCAIRGCVGPPGPALQLGSSYGR